jgi:hypothetical protein
MAFTRVIKSRSQLNDTAEDKLLPQGGKGLLAPVGHDQNGIALFIVLAAVGVLTILVTEFTYVSQITQAIAFGSLDQVKAHYLAKSALKLSLLRLKAFKHIKDKVKSMGGTGVVPQGMVDQIWSFPLSYPFPTNIPGLSQTDKDSINKFQNGSGFEGGSYWTTISSESSKYNLNLLLSNYAPIPTASATPGSLPLGQGQPTPTPSAVALDPEAAREGLYTYLNEILNHKIQTDTDFADNRRNFRLQDLVDNISSWVGQKLERRTGAPTDLKIPFKKAPFYSITELHMIPMMDDELYNILSPALTTSTTNGININTMQEPVLRALIPRITAEEVTDFFKFRDSTEANNKFTKSDSFFDYLQRGVSGFMNSPPAVANLKNDLARANILLITEENQFKIKVEAKVNNSYRTIEAWVELSDGTKTPPPPGAIQGGQNYPNGNTPNGPPGNRTIPDPGLRITFMKIM